MDLMVLEVDGSLANPLVVTVVAVWAVVLSALLVSAVARLRRRQLSGVVLALVAIASMTVTRHAQQIIGDRIAWIGSDAVVVVDFWGGPPTWVAPAVAVALGVVFGLRRPRPPDPPPRSGAS